jgi:hypothetical protein
LSKKPTLCIEFDGVIHSFTTPCSITETPDPPVPGAVAFLLRASEEFSIAIFSVRSAHEEGRKAMASYVYRIVTDYGRGEGWTEEMNAKIIGALEGFRFPSTKPEAFVTIDDCAITFKGVWPDMEVLRSFKPWNKGEEAA